MTNILDGDTKATKCSSTAPIFQHVLVGDKDSTVLFGRHDIPSGKCTAETSKRISRVHCRIEWDGEKSNFILKVLGANGLRIKGRLYTSSQEIILSSNTVIDFVGFRTMFIDPETTDNSDFIPSKKPKLLFSKADSKTTTPLNRKSISSKNSEKSTDNINTEDVSLNFDVSTSIDGSHGILSSFDGLDSFIKNESASKKTNILDDFEKDILTPDSLDQLEPKTKTKPSSKKVITRLTQSTSQPEDETFINLVLHKLIEMDKRTPVALVSLYDELSKTYQPSAAEPEFTLDILSDRLSSLPMFVHVPTLGNTELLRLGQYYYEPSFDWNTSRSFEVGTVVRKPRGCTLSSKQYYFKPIPKIPKPRGPSFSGKKL